MDMQTRSDVTSIRGDVVTLPVERYLDEFMWRERHGSTASTALASLSGHCAQLPRLKNVGFRVVPSAGSHLRQFLLCALYRFL